MRARVPYLVGTIGAGRTLKCHIYTRSLHQSGVQAKQLSTQRGESRGPLRKRKRDKQRETKRTNSETKHDLSDSRAFLEDGSRLKDGDPLGRFR